MRIVAKLTIAFLGVAFLVFIIGYISTAMVQKALKSNIGETSIIISSEALDKVDQAIYRMAQLTKLYAHSLTHYRVFSGSNKEFESMENIQAYIEKVEKEWAKPGSDGKASVMEEILSNRLSQHLRRDIWFEGDTYHNEGEYTFLSVEEAFVTNKYGVNIAQTSPTSDYYQGDEEWWKVSKEKDIYIGDIKYDESSGTYSIEMCSSIHDSDGSFAGVIKIVININEIASMLGEMKKRIEHYSKKLSNLMEYDFKLVNNDGKVFSSTEDAGFVMFEELDKEIWQAIRSENPGYLISEGDKEGEGERLYAFSKQDGYRDFKGFGWYLIVEIEKDQLFSSVKDLIISLLLLSLIISIIAIAIGFYISKTIVDPINRLKDTAKKISSGDFDANIDIKSQDEIGELGASFKEMASSLKEKQVIQDKWSEELEGKIEDRTSELVKSQAATLNMMEDLQEAYIELKKTQSYLVQAEKMEGIGRMASGVAHEVKNPLGIVLQGVNFLERKIPESQQELYKVLLLIKDNIKRADNIVNSLVDFSKATKLELGKEDINSLLEEILSLVKHRVDISRTEIIKEFSRDLPKVLVDKGKMEQVYMNLIINAIQAMPHGGRLSLRTYISILNKIGNGAGKRSQDNFQINEKVVITEIEDTGCGIPEENIKKVFEPFFTTKDPQSGTGLGLAVTKNIIDLHKSYINIESEFGKGTKFTIYLKIV
ncbi:MAG: ATP-binding protein [Candidatus Omnitrophota bacterium]